jgi:hypothetical protein
LFNPPQDRDNRQSTTARQAAEALFTPKKEPPSREPEGAVAHKPRILAALPLARPDLASAVVTQTQAPRRAIPKSQVDRIRNWLRY